MDLNPFRMTRVPGSVTITFAADRLIEVCFRDSVTGDVVEDCTGDRAALMSAMLANLPEDKLDELAEAVCVDVLKIIKGLD